MVPALDYLDSIVPISDFNRGKASAAFKRVSSGAPIVVMKHNTPSYVIMEIDDYLEAAEAEEDLELLSLAVSRARNFDPSKCISLEDLMDKYGITQEEIDAMPEVEFE